MKTCVNMSHNAFTGPINPPLYFQGSNNLADLDLSFNRLSGTLPDTSSSSDGN